MKIAQDGIQHKILEKEIIINCITKCVFNLLCDCDMLRSLGLLNV